MESVDVRYYVAMVTQNCVTTMINLTLTELNYLDEISSSISNQNISNLFLPFERTRYGFAPKIDQWVGKLLSK
jgi:hypothetical protein